MWSTGRVPGPHPLPQVNRSTGSRSTGRPLPAKSTGSVPGPAQAIESTGRTHHPTRSTGRQPGQSTGQMPGSRSLPSIPVNWSSLGSVNWTTSTTLPVNWSRIRPGIPVNWSGTRLTTTHPTHRSTGPEPGQTIQTRPPTEIFSPSRPPPLPPSSPTKSAPVNWMSTRPSHAYPVNWSSQRTARMINWSALTLPLSLSSPNAHAPGTLSPSTHHLPCRSWFAHTESHHLETSAPGVYGGVSQNQTTYRLTLSTS